jgi:NAD(P)H-hydrate epimerase
MKIFTVDKIRKADEYTIRHEPIGSLYLMERASMQLANWILAHYSKKYELLFLLGKGNNAGDGLALCRILENYGYHCTVFLALGEQGTKDFEQNLDRLPNQVQVLHATAFQELLMLAKKSQYTLWIDGLIGTGLSRPVKGKLAEILSEVNKQVGDKLAIDIPSGLFADRYTNGISFKAATTLSFQFPKLAFMMPENHLSVGKWIILPIGLHEKYIESENTSYFLTEGVVFPSVNEFAHKGTRGRCTIIAGGYGRMGAAVLAAQACLKSGIGLLSVQACHHCVEVIQNAVPEVLIKVDQYEYALGDYLAYGDQQVLAFGPAVGFADKTKLLFETILDNYKGQLILDADAITMLSENKALLNKLSVGTILTPHIGEFDRLVGSQENNFDRINALRAFAKKYKCIVLLKGRYSAISDTNGTVHFNSTGNHGMAKGGSGDVLTGIIAALFPAFKDPLKATIAAVYMHGLAGDMAASKLGAMGMNATDLIENLHRAQKKLM